MPRVVCAGHVNWDVTLCVDRLPEADGESCVRSRHQAGGGSAGNVAAALAGLDVAVGLLGSVGDDEHGRQAARDLERAGVDLGGLRRVDGATAVKYLLVDDAGEVAVLGAAGANEAVGPDDVDPAEIQTADHVHLTGQRPATATRIAELAREAGVPVSFDPGRRIAERDYRDVLSLADVLFLNEREARALGAPPADCVVVTKRGGDGATVRLPDGAQHTHPGFGLETVDAAGAGDAFAAGYLATLLGAADGVTVPGEGEDAPGDGRDAGRGAPGDATSVEADGAGEADDVGEADDTEEADDAAIHRRALAVGNACGALCANGSGARASLSWDAVGGVLAGE